MVHAPGQKPPTEVLPGNCTATITADQISGTLSIQRSECLRRTFDVSILAETELVPALQHSASVVEPMGFLLSHFNHQGTVSSGDLTGVVPLEISGGPI